MRICIQPIALYIYLLLIIVSHPMISQSAFDKKLNKLSHLLNCLLLLNCLFPLNCLLIFLQLKFCGVNYFRIVFHFFKQENQIMKSMFDPDWCQSVFSFTKIINKENIQLNSLLNGIFGSSSQCLRTFPLVRVIVHSWSEIKSNL